MPNETTVSRVFFFFFFSLPNTSVLHAHIADRYHQRVVNGTANNELTESIVFGTVNQCRKRLASSC